MKHPPGLSTDLFTTFEEMNIISLADDDKGVGITWVYVCARVSLCVCVCVFRYL